MQIALTKKKKTFKSKLEVSVAELLDTVGCKYVYEGEQVPYTIQHHYNPDFVLLNGVMLETKGYWAVSYTHLTLPTKA